MSGRCVCGRFGLLIGARCFTCSDEETRALIEQRARRALDNHARSMLDEQEEETDEL